MRRALRTGLATLAALIVARLGVCEDEACFAPAAGIDDSELSAPGEEGFDRAVLCAVLERAAHSDANLHAVLVERHGRLVAELYRTRPDRPIDVLYGLWNPLGSDVAFGPDVLHDTRSVSKSVVGLLFGVALEKGWVSGVDVPAVDVFPELADLRTPERNSILLRHLLSMSSGLDWDEGALPNDETRLFWTADPVRFLFDRRLVAEPGAEFRYDSGGTAALALLLERVSGKTLPQLAREALFEPLGITHWSWADDLRGRPLAFTGLRMRPRDMVRLGRLALQHGEWRGRRVVAETWLAESLRTHVATGVRIPPEAPTELGYGYQWWTGQVAWKERTLAWSAAFGNGGQRIFVVPELDLVVVTTAGEYGSLPIAGMVAEIFASVVGAVAR